MNYFKYSSDLVAPQPCVFRLNNFDLNTDECRYLIHAGEFAKYNKFTLAKLEFSDTAICELRKRYMSHRGLPMFIQDKLNFKKNPPQRKIMNDFPSTVSWTSDGSFVLSPNGTYCGELDGIVPENMKRLRTGFALCGWFVHPALLAHTVFQFPGFRSDYSLTARSDLGIYDPNAEWVSREVRSEAGPTNQQLEDLSNHKYYSSPLDLTESDIPWLQSVRSHILLQLNEVYQLDPEDKVDIYIHDLYLEKCSTLHIHVRVNRAAHPLDDRCRIRVDEAIHELRESGSLHRLYLSHGSYKRTSNSLAGGILHEVDGLTIREHENVSYRCSHQFVMELAGKPFGSYL